MSTLYERISELCESKGMTVSAMCREAGISTGNMSELKAGRRKSISLDTAFKIAKVLDADVEYLYRGTITETPPLSAYEEHSDTIILPEPDPEWIALDQKYKDGTITEDEIIRLSEMHRKSFEAGKEALPEISARAHRLLERSKALSEMKALLDKLDATPMKDIQDKDIKRLQALSDILNTNDDQE